MEKLRRGERVMFVCIGDSITEQNFHLRGKLNYVGQLAEKLIDTYGRKFLLLNAGVSGDTSWGVKDRLERDALRFAPDLVTVMLGMNDCQRGPELLPEFRRNLETIVTRIAAAGSEALLLTQNALDYNVCEPSVLARVHYPAYVDVLRRMAEETGTPLCDIGRVWEQRVGGATNMHLLLMNDGIHPGEAGHRLFAETLFDYLGITNDAL